MKLADENVTGKLIADLEQRASWLELVLALQGLSAKEDGPLSGWVFHGTDE